MKWCVISFECHGFLFNETLETTTNLEERGHIHIVKEEFLWMRISLLHD